MFDQVKLKKDGWYSRLQIWTFGKVPYTNNFCPFFWLTIFCLISFPFVASFRLSFYTAKKIISYIGNAIVFISDLLDYSLDCIDTKLCRPLYTKQVNKYVDNINEEDAYNLFKNIFGEPTWYSNKFDKPYKRNKFINFKEKKQSYYLDRWNAWKSSNDDWEEKLKKIKEERDAKAKERADAERILLKAKRERERERNKIEAKKLKIREEKLKIREERVKQTFLMLAKYTKYLVLLVFGVVSIYVLYLVGILYLIIYENLDGISSFLDTAGNGIWTFIKYGIPAVVAVLIFSGVVYYTLKLFVKLITKCNIHISMPKLPEETKFKKWRKRMGDKFSDFIYNIGEWLETQIDKVIVVVKFFTIFIKSFKENNCPAIEWEDDEKK